MGRSSLASQIIALNGTFVIFQDCILILDSSLSNYYERYDRFFHHFRRFRRFRSFVSFRSFRKRARRNGGGGGGVNVLVQLTRLVAMLRISTRLELKIVCCYWVREGIAGSLRSLS